MQSKQVRPPTGLDRLWGMAPRQRRGPAPRLSMENVVDAAVALADEQGLGAVTLAAVAKRVGLTTTALYGYVDTKDVLNELMADRALGQPPTLDSGSWKDAASEWARALRQAYVRHPWLTAMSPAGPTRRPGPYLWMQELLPHLKGAPMHRPQAIALMLDCLVRGYASVGQPGPPQPWLTGVLTTRFPTLAEAFTEDDWSDVDAEFDTALSALLAGIDDH